MNPKYIVTLITLGFLCYFQACSAGELLCYEGTDNEPAGHATGCPGDKPYCYVSGMEGGPVKERGCAIPVGGEKPDRKNGETCQWNGKDKMSECKCFEDYCNKREMMTKE